LYEGLDITGAIGLSTAQQASLLRVGAVDLLQRDDRPMSAPND
jgi:hypothetical protein